MVRSGHTDSEGSTGCSARQVDCVNIEFDDVNATAER
jgi:hypothetical protein